LILGMEKAFRYLLTIYSFILYPINKAKDSIMIYAVEFGENYQLIFKFQQIIQIRIQPSRCYQHLMKMLQMKVGELEISLSTLWALILMIKLNQIAKQYLLTSSETNLLMQMVG
jgi:hypothetical protein